MQTITTLHTGKPLADLGIVADPTATGIERYTHKPTGRAIVRQPYMSDARWSSELQAFADAIEPNQTRQQK